MRRVRKVVLIPVLIFGVPAAGLVGFFGLRIERYEGLGHGFFLLSRWRPINGGFESVYHYRERRHYFRNLGRTGDECFVSPSGRFALYESFDRDGKTLLFDADSGKISDVTDGSFAIPSQVDWRESLQEANVLYYENHKPSLIHLPN
jgi:hypothetical protein